MTGLTGDVFSPWLFQRNSHGEKKEPSLTIHLQAKRWVAVVECIGFPTVVSVLLKRSSGLPVPQW